VHTQETTVNHQELEHKIVANAKELFLKIGIRSVTMEDVAKSLGISKKTIYSVFDNKAALVHNCVSLDINIRKEEINRIFSANHNAIEEMIYMSINVSQLLKNIAVSVVYDLQKFFPETWQLLLDYKLLFIKEHIVMNLRKGIATGLYRENMDVEMISRLYIANADNIFNTQVFPVDDYDPVNTYTALIKYHLYAIATENGKEILEINYKKIEI
jgi:AcrR family transcriptional regulator